MKWLPHWLAKRWWHTCPVCWKTFRRGQGGGYTKDVVCSDYCWQLAFVALTGKRDDSV